MYLRLDDIKDHFINTMGEDYGGIRLAHTLQLLTLGLLGVFQAARQVFSFKKI